MAIAPGTARNTSGLDLRLRRVAAGITQTTLAVEMGVSRRRVGNIEALLRPPPTAAARYVVALRAVLDE